MAEKLLTFATGRGVEYYDAPAIRKIVSDARAWRLPLLIAHPRCREQHAVSNEASIIMMILKKAMPRRTFLRGMGATVALPLLDAMVPSLTAQTQTAANPVRRLSYVYMPMGSDLPRWTPPVETGPLTQLSVDAQPARAGDQTRHHRLRHGVEKRVSRDARDFERGVSERGQGEVDGEQRLLPRNDSRSDRREADRSGDAAAVARARRWI